MEHLIVSDMTPLYECRERFRKAMAGWWDCERIDRMICRLLGGGLEEKVRGSLKYLLNFMPALLCNFQSRARARMVYFAPCHQREQDVGTPYEKLLGLIPGLQIRRVGGAMDCCGMGGSLGFKKSFHEASTRMGRPLMQKIEAAAPEAIVTDCLSCRLQFKHALPYPVWHPLELLARAYDVGQ